MNKNILIVLGGAVLIAVLVAVLVQVTLGGKKNDAPVVAEAKVRVLVADKDLVIGRELKDGDTRWQEWPKNSVFPGAIVREDGQSPEEALEGRLARNIAKGEPVMKSAMLGESKGNVVAASLKPGQRAVSFQVDAESMVAGFIGPGDFVDVILTYSESVDSDDEDPRVIKAMELGLDKMATETILQNVKVLAVDQRTAPPEDGKIKVGKTVTVAVDLQDAERLALANRLGTLTLTLRGIGDDQLVDTKWPVVSDARLTTIGDEIYAEYEKIKKDAGISSDIVRIYNGQQVVAVPAQ